MFIPGITASVLQAAPPAGTPYDIGTGAVALPGGITSFDADLYTQSLSAVTFSPDGTKMYTLSFSDGVVWHYELSPAWDVTSATPTSISGSVSAQEASPNCLAFSSDGTKMYIAGVDSHISQYTLSTPWVVSSAVYNFDGSITGPCTGIHFNADGTKVYIMYSSPGVNSYLNSYTLSTPWLITSMTDDAVWKELTADDDDMSAIHINPDGTILHTAGDEFDSVYQYALSPAFDLSSATLTATMDVSSLDGFPSGIKWDDTGTIMYVSGTFTETVYQIPKP